MCPFQTGIAHAYVSVEHTIFVYTWDMHLNRSYMTENIMYTGLSPIRSILFYEGHDRFRFERFDGSDSAGRDLGPGPGQLCPPAQVSF